MAYLLSAGALLDFALPLMKTIAADPSRPTAWKNGVSIDNSPCIG